MELSAVRRQVVEDSRWARRTSNGKNRMRRRRTKRDGKMDTQRERERERVCAVSGTSEEYPSSDGCRYFRHSTQHSSAWQTTFRSIDQLTRPRWRQTSRPTPSTSHSASRPAGCCIVGPIAVVKPTAWVIRTRPATRLQSLDCDSGVNASLWLERGRRHSLEVVPEDLGEPDRQTLFKHSFLCIYGSGIQFVKPR